MSPFAPRNPLFGVLCVWVVVLLMGITVVVVVPAAARGLWLALVLAFAFLLALLTQLRYGEARGFIQRVALSVAGSLFLLGLVSAVLGIVMLASATA